MSTLKVTNIRHENSGIDTLVFDNGGSNGQNGRVTTKGTIGAIHNQGTTLSGDITLDFRNGNNFSMTLTGNSELKNPTTMAAGQSGVLFITQGVGGNHLLSYDTYWDFPDGGTPPVLSTTAGQVDMIVWIARSATNISAQLVANFS